MKSATHTPAVVILADTIRRRAEEPGLPTLPLPWLRSRLVKRNRERRVFSIGLIPTSRREVVRYKVCTPMRDEVRAFILFLLVHLADVNDDLEHTEVEVTPLMLSCHLDATDTEVVDVVWELVHHSQLKRPEAQALPRVFSFRDFENCQQARRQRIRRARSGRQSRHGSKVRR